METNNAPFFIGQQVVALVGKKGDYIIKGSPYVVDGIRQLICGCWTISVGVINEHSQKYFECDKHKCNPVYGGKMRWFYSTLFAPINPLYADIRKELAKEAMNVRDTADQPVKEIQN